MSGIKRRLAVATQGFPHAVAITSANVSDRNGAELVFERCAEALQTVKSVLADGGHTGEDFADEVLGTLGATVQIAKRNELHTFEVIPQRWIVERSFGRGNAVGCGRTASANSIRACNSSTWLSWRWFSRDFEHVLMARVLMAREIAFSHETAMYQYVSLRRRMIVYLYCRKRAMRGHRLSRAMCRRSQRLSALGDGRSLGGSI